MKDVVRVQRLMLLMMSKKVKSRFGNEERVLIYAEAGLQGAGVVVVQAGVGRYRYGYGCGRGCGLQAGGEGRAGGGQGECLSVGGGASPAGPGSRPGVLVSPEVLTLGPHTYVHSEKTSQRRK